MVDIDIYNVPPLRLEEVSRAPKGSLCEVCLIGIECDGRKRRMIDGVESCGEEAVLELGPEIQLRTCLTCYSRGRRDDDPTVEEIVKELT